MIRVSIKKLHLLIDDLIFVIVMQLTQIIFDFFLIFIFVFFHFTDLLSQIFVVFYFICYFVDDLLKKTKLSNFN